MPPVYGFARRIVRDPRARALADVVPRTAFFLARHWGRTKQAPAESAMSSTARFSAGFAGQVLLDEFLIAALKDPALIPHGDDYEHAADDLRAAINRYEREGWTED